MIDYDELDPGIRETIRFFNERGFVTSDSGDGVSKMGTDQAECAMEWPNVIIPVRDPFELVARTNDVANALRAIGIEPAGMGPDGFPGVNVSGSYDADDRIAIITVFNLDDAKLRQAMERAR